VFCVQRIRSTVEEREQKQLLMDLDVVMRSNNCPFIVQFYGALFKEVNMFFHSPRVGVGSGGGIV
jgi:mitogen-activated protein kinase kinase 4